MGHEDRAWMPSHRQFSLPQPSRKPRMVPVRLFDEDRVAAGPKPPVLPVTAAGSVEPGKNEIDHDDRVGGTTGRMWPADAARSKAFVL